MNFKTCYIKIKKNGFSILLISFLLLVTFSQDSKSWLLQQLVSIGLFRAEIKKTGFEKFPPAATFHYTDARGITTSIADLKGKVIFINFWASWCPPCRAEMPSIAALYNKFLNDNRFVFLFINEEENKTTAIHYLEKYHYDIPLLGISGNVPSEIFSGTLPTTIVINKEGEIVMKHEGMAGYDSNSFIKLLKELL